MKQQILAKLVTKYPGLSKVFLGLIADKMATKVTEESGIDEAITALDNAPISITDLAAEFQKEGDRRVTAAEKEFKKKNPPKPPEKTEPEEEAEEDHSEATPAKPKGERVPAWAKGLLSEVQALRSEKAQTTIKSKLAARFSEKGKEVPEVIWGKRPLPEKEEDIEAFETEVRTDWEAYTKTDTEKGLSALGQPRSATGGPAGGVKPASKEEVNALVKDIM